MKKLVLSLLFVATVATTAFAAGENKLGFYFGLPGGISYTRDLGKSMDLDILAGFDFFRTRDFKTEGYSVHVRVAPLFNLWNGGMGPVNGTFSVGPGFGLIIGGNNHQLGVGYSISAPIRFDIDFRIPLNLFFEVAPGFAHTFWPNAKTRYYGFYLGGGLGVRYRF